MDDASDSVSKYVYMEYFLLGGGGALSLVKMYEFFSIS